MAYEPTTWKSGDVVTSAKLNKIEQGIANAGGGGVFVVGLDMQTMTLNKTWQEIFDAGFPVVLASPGEGMTIYMTPLLVTADNGRYDVFVMMLSQGSISVQDFVTDSADGYPVLDQG